MRKIPLFVLSVLLLAPSLARAVNAQAQEYDELGLSLYRQGLYAKAISYFQNAVQADPADWQGYENLGNAYYKINDNADALSAYQKSLQINPDNSTLENITQNLQANGGSAASDNSTAANPPSNPSVNNSENPSADAQSPAFNPPPAGAAPPGNSQSSVDSEQPIGNGQPGQPNEYQNAPPAPGAIVVRHRRRGWSTAQPEPVYNDNLAPMDHAKFWVEADLAYNWSNQADFFNAAAGENSYIQQNGFTGIASADHGGIELGAEFGFLLDPYNGIAIGIHDISSNQYNSNVNYQNGGDFETVNIQPAVYPLTLDYYLFLPDHNGRFFLTAGIGYYFADVSADDNFSYNITNGNTNSADDYAGHMYGGNVGFQLGVGREFELSSHLGLRIFARGRYCKITDINGYFTSAAGAYDNYGLVSGPGLLGGGMAVDSTSNIGSNGEHYATLDYTGFDLGLGLTFF